MPKCSLCGNDFAGNGILCPACYAKTPRTVVATRRKVPGTQQYIAILRVAPMTTALIAINLLIYVLMAVSTKSIDFSVQTLVNWGGDYAPLTRNGEWWRLLTSTFVHGGLLHVGLNMWCLLMLGPLAEVAFGKFPYLAAYIATGLCSSLTSTLYHPTSIGVGASGAIFGVAGFLITPIALKRLTVYSTGKSSTLKMLVQFALLNLVIGAAIPVVDVSAHVGGLVAGLIIGLFFALKPRTVGYAPDPPPARPTNSDDQSFESRSTREIGR
jgi:membrane associated rhomboid family serine protease